MCLERRAHVCINVWPAHSGMHGQKILWKDLGLTTFLNSLGIWEDERGEKKEEPLEWRGYIKEMPTPKKGLLVASGGIAYLWLSSL